MNVAFIFWNVCINSFNCSSRHPNQWLWTAYNSKLFKTIFKTTIQHCEISFHYIVIMLPYCMQIIKYTSIFIVVLVGHLEGILKIHTNNCCCLNWESDVWFLSLSSTCFYQSYNITRVKWRLIFIFKEDRKKMNWWRECILSFPLLYFACLFSSLLFQIRRWLNKDAKKERRSSLSLYIWWQWRFLYGIRCKSHMFLKNLRYGQSCLYDEAQ